MNKFVKLGNYTYFEMKWFLSYLYAILYGTSNNRSKDHIEVYVFILTDDSIRITQCSPKHNVSSSFSKICIRKQYDFIGYENNIANAFVFKSSIYKSSIHKNNVLIPIGCFKIYTKQKNFDDDEQSTDITTIERVLESNLANTTEYRAYSYNRELFHYAPELPHQSLYNRKWRKNENIQVCEVCNKNFSLLIRKHHCRYCGRIICSNCYSSFPLKSWFEKNGTIHNNKTDPGDVEERTFCKLCFDKAEALLASGGKKKKNKYIKRKKVTVKKVGVYRSKGGYYYRRYKNGKRKRISKEMYYKLKKV